MDRDRRQSFDAVPADFNGRLLAPEWDRFDEIVENAQVRVPALARRRASGR